MPNISTSNTNSIYKYTGSFTTLFKNDKDPITIESLRIKSIVIDYNYTKHNLPLIYATLALTYEMVTKLKNNMNTGTILVNIQKYIENSDMPGLKIDTIKKECTYFMAADVGKENEQAINKDKTEDYGYIMTIGFIPVDVINKSKVNINGVINKGTMSAVLMYLLKDHNVLMEPLTHNDKLLQVFIPPNSSTASMIKYLNRISAFYDTQYRFFIDFDNTYLISSSGKGLRKKGELINTIKIKLVKEYDETSMEGMYEDKDAKVYLIQVTSLDCNLAESQMTDKMATDVQGVSTAGATNKIAMYEKDKNTVLKQDTPNTVRISNNNTALLKNITSSSLNNAVTITIMKNKIDGTIFTLNKIYYIDAAEVFGAEYNGNYLLSSKKEVYVQEGEGLAMSVMLSFNKIYIDKSNQKENKVII